jgi:hypothetical protein
LVVKKGWPTLVPFLLNVIRQMNIGMLSWNERNQVTSREDVKRNANI